MSNIIEFKVGTRQFVIYQAPAIELVDLILAIQDLGEVVGDEFEFRVNRKNYKEFASLLLNTTFISEKSGDGTDIPVTNASFVGIEDAPVLMEFIREMTAILMESAYPVIDEVTEKKTESTNSLKETKKGKIRPQPKIKAL